jgi:membrane protein implicated in regulation of membrane protease activity
MRFIIEFLVFGLIFYAISIYLPEVFQVMVGAAAKIFDVLRETFSSLMQRVQSGSGTPAATPQSLLLFYGFFRSLLP